MELGTWDRASQLYEMGYTAEQAARRMNAEFKSCFYANKDVLWVSYVKDTGRVEQQSLGAFKQ
jgi:hypothetical protein